MKFKFRSTLVDAENRKARNFNYIVETDQWLEHMRSRPEFYGNVPSLIEESLLPALDSHDQKRLAAFIVHLDEQCLKINANIIFELAMFVWAEFRKRRVSADQWGLTLGLTWQSGHRGMLAGVALSQATVLEMFREAPTAAIHWSVDPEGEAQRKFDQLPDELQVFRGVSTGIDHYEDGLSWTTNPVEARNFMGHNTHNSKEIPGLLTAVVPKKAVLAMFDFEDEVVVDPTVRKVEVERHFLRGPELRAFRKWIDVGRRGEQMLSYEAPRRFSGMTSGRLK